MSEEKKELKNELKKNECCKGKEKLSIEELEQVSGGGLPANYEPGVEIDTPGANIYF